MLLALGTWASRLRDTRASLPRTCDHVRPRHPGAVAPAPPASRTRTPHARRPSGSADGTPWGATGDAGLRATAPLSALLSVDRPRLGPVFVEAALQPRRGPQDQRQESARARPQHMDHPCSQRHPSPPDASNCEAKATGSARYGIQPTASSHGADVQAQGAGAAESCTAAGAPPCCRAVRCRQLRQWRR